MITNIMLILLQSGAAGATPQAPHYESALQCLVAINDAHSLERAFADGKPPKNAQAFDNAREKYKSILVFEGLHLGKTREQIVDEYKSRQDRSDAISKPGNMAELRASYDTQLRKAAACIEQL